VQRHCATLRELSSLYVIGLDTETWQRTCCVDPHAFSQDEIDDNFWTSIPTARTETSELGDPTRWGVDLGRRGNLYTHGASRTRCVRDPE
jgi:hypothetical protein